MNKEKNKIDLEEFANEEVVFVLKQSPSFFGRVFFVSIFFLIVIFISFYFWGASAITSYVILASLIVVGYYFLYYYYLWSKTMYILTNERIISQKQKGWFAKTINETSLDNIRFVSHSIKGITQHILNNGNVYIRSSLAEEGGLKIENIADPYEVQKAIIETQKKYASKSAESMSEKEYQKEARKKGPIIR